MPWGTRSAEIELVDTKYTAFGSGASFRRDSHLETYGPFFHAFRLKDKRLYFTLTSFKRLEELFNRDKMAVVFMEYPV